MCFTVFAVYKDDQIVSAGSLLDCWRWILYTYQQAISDLPLVTAFDLAEAGVYIAPVGDHNPNFKKEIKKS